MSDDVRENIRAAVQRMIPFFFSLLLILLDYIPSHLGIPHVIRPATGFICVFYWVLHRSDLFNMFTVFFLGFISDIMSSAPLGADIIAYLTVYVMVSNMTTFFNNKPFVAVWYGFSFIFAAGVFVKWLLVSVYYGQFLPVGNLFFTFLFTIACYPVVSFFNELAQKYLMNDEV